MRSSSATSSPHPVRPTGRVLGQQEIALLLGACTPTSRTPIATALYTGLRISELLGLTWSDLDLREGTLRVRAQLSRASHGSLLPHDLRRTFASHLIIDAGLDVVQVSRMLGHASASTTLDIYAHMFDHARHGADLRGRMSASAFLSLLDQTTETPERAINVIPFPSRAHAAGRPHRRMPSSKPEATAKSLKGAELPDNATDHPRPTSSCRQSPERSDISRASAAHGSSPRRDQAPQPLKPPAPTPPGGSSRSL